MDISSTSPLVPFSHQSPNGPTQDQLSYPPLHFDYSKVHIHQSPPSLYQHQPSYYSSPPPLSPRSPGPDRIYIEESITDGRFCEESPRDGFRQLNRHMKPPTLKFTNNCQLAVMRLDRLGDDSPMDSLKHDNDDDDDDRVCGGSTRSSTSFQGTSTTTPTEFLLNSAKSPSIGLSSLPSNSAPEKKPPLACLFCRGRKIACGPPLPGSIRRTCNQCRKRSLQCHYPSESRRGMRKKKPPNDSNTTTAGAVAKKTKKTKSHRVT